MVLDVIPAGKTTATVLFTQQQIDDLRGSPGRSRVPVLISYAGQEFRTSIAIYRGKWMMVVNAAMRAGGMTPGTACEVDIVMDVEARTVEVPAELAQQLAEHGLAERWSSLSYTRRKEIVSGVESARQSATRERRIAAAIAGLRD